MTDLRVPALAALVLVGICFLAGVRVAFVRPKRRHRYRASRVSGAILGAEVIAIAAAPVPPGRAAAALALLAVALGLFLWAAWANRARKLGLAFAEALPEHVQSGGPYALVRHPFYASYLLAFLGGAVAAGSPWLVPAVFAGALTYWRAARDEEERFARSPLAVAYGEYAARTGMFLPFLPHPRYGSTPGNATPASSRSPDGNAG
ncbi:MAG TPA: isoprenylcysteine carboxylmethyltransferase family protein [Anaeromyxobacter sp.]